MIDAKDKEIGKLREMLKQTQISQIDGEDFIDDTENDDFSNSPVKWKL